MNAQISIPDPVMPHPTVDPQTAWKAVEARDADFDGRFVLAVTTTGIYCRPSCPARKPRPENVRFFPGPDAAEAAGFRACKRCHPRGEKPAPGAERAEQARRYLEEHLDDNVTLEELGRAVGTSPAHLQRIFQATLGLSPKQYVRARRLERLKTSLKEGQNVLDATFEAGYGAASRAYDPASAPLGMTPATYRRGGRGMHIRYAIVASALGQLLVAATERGVSAVMLGEDDDRLAAELRREYPNATCEPASDGLGTWVTAVVEHLRGGADSRALPLDVEATVFQWRVWQALREIPYGATRTYSELAEAIGEPTAVRAVARACASNPVAVTVPCHRIVRKSGELGGYRWGIERKQRLLETEAGGE